MAKVILKAKRAIRAICKDIAFHLDKQLIKDDTQRIIEKTYKK